MDYKKYREKIRNAVNRTSRNCLLNVTRQIGTTTTLLEYAVDYYVGNKKSIVCCFNKRSRFEHMLEIVKGVVLQKGLGSSFIIDKYNYVIRDINDKQNSIVFTTGASNFEKIMENNEHLSDIQLLIVDDADFYNWLPLKKIIESKHVFVKTIASSCPSSFNGTWNAFKRIYVSQPMGWDVCKVTGTCNEELREKISTSHYDMEFNNYELFFEKMRLLYRNLGLFLFLEKAPLYCPNDKMASNKEFSNFLNVSKWALENQKEIENVFVE